MFYTIYKITNLINGKFYIGKHQTKDLDDGYMGSGKLLKHAIKKYGVENFRKDILEVYDQEWKMNLAERVLVVVDPEISYNLCSGGKGGFGYINNHASSRIIKNRKAGKITTTLHRKKLSEWGRKGGLINPLENAKRKISNSLKQYYSNPENVLKFKSSFIGRIRIYRSDGSWFWGRK